MHAKHGLYIRTLLRTLQAGIKNINPLITNLSRLLWKNLGSFIRASTVLYCTVLYSTVLYCTVLYSTVLYCTVLYCTVLYCTVLYCTVLHCTALYCTVLYCTVLYCTVLDCTVLCLTALYCTVTLQAGIKNINPPVKNLSRLLRKT